MAVVVARATVDSGVVLGVVVGEDPKMEWIDLRACLCRMDLSDVRGELSPALASGALVPVWVKGTGEGVRANRMDQEEEMER